MIIELVELPQDFYIRDPRYLLTTTFESKELYERVVYITKMFLSRGVNLKNVSWEAESAVVFGYMHFVLLSVKFTYSFEDLLNSVVSLVTVGNSIFAKGVV